MTEDPSLPADWQQSGLHALASIEVDAMAAFEVLLLDDLAGYLMGAGPLEPPYTVEHGSRVVSALLGAMQNSARYTPSETPAPDLAIEAARIAFVQGAHDLAALGASGLAQLVNRLIPAALGELEIYKGTPEDQTCSMFYYSMLAVASGPSNQLDEAAAAGVMRIFRAWDVLFGRGFVPPWRHPVSHES